MNLEPIVLAMVSAMMLLDDTSPEEIDPDVASYIRGIPFSLGWDEEPPSDLP